MRMAMGLAAVAAVAVSAVALAGGPAGGGGPKGAAERAGERLGEAIERAIKAEGPFFTAAERAVIERKCGYPAGSWDGFEANVTNGVFHCKDGRRVDDAEMRALLAAAEPRIERRVRASMEREDVQAAIRAVAEEAERQALAAIDQAAIAREAAREAKASVREAVEEARREAERARARARK
jgi:hypothetical protein